MTFATRERFVALWLRNLEDPESASERAAVIAHEIYSELVRRYSEFHRVHHTLEHIDYCLGVLDQHKHLAHFLDAIEMALWFHDYIYELGEPHNEMLSAFYFLRISANCGLNKGFAFVAASFISATAKHVALSKDGRLVCDVDMSILGAPTEEYMAYRDRIYAEYSSIPAHEFIAGRIALFLEPTLASPQIFQTDAFRAKYEAQARKNLQLELKILQSRNN